MRPPPGARRLTRVSEANMVHAMTESLDETSTTEATPTPTVSDTFATVDALYRYPVKGLTPERLELVELKAG
jgi:hypothetical protein